MLCSHTVKVWPWHMHRYTWSHARPHMRTHIHIQACHIRIIGKTERMGLEISSLVKYICKHEDLSLIPAFQV